MIPEVVEENKNGVKNGESTQFSSDNQPSSESKKAGWARRKQGQMFMDRVAEYLEMTISEVETLEKLMEQSKEKFTVRESLALRYVINMTKSDKLLIHWLDIHISKAPHSMFNDENAEDRLEEVLVRIVGAVSNEYDPKELEQLSQK